MVEETETIGKEENGGKDGKEKRNGRDAEPSGSR